MNAIILAAGLGTRMAKDGYSINKPLLPILGIPNIERTVIMLKAFGIDDIIVICRNEYINQYIYLKECYNCQIVDVSSNLNTLYSISCVIDRIDDTFVIEGDVVLAKSIFIKSKNSFYYTMKYSDCESDAWCPILMNGRIVDFKIGKFSEPCIFGVSYWNHDDSNILKSKLRSMFTNTNFNDKTIFWDDCVRSILDQIHICVYELNQTQASEMNTGDEYIIAQNMCERYYCNCEKYIVDGPNNFASTFNIEFIKDLDICSKWQKRLIKYMNNNFNNYLEDLPLPIVFDKGEYPFMIRDKTTQLYLAYIDIAESTNYFLLRRIFIDEKYRRKGLGTEIINYLKTYSKLSGKEMRVNVYDENAEQFYKSLGMFLYFKTYRI